MQILTLQLHLQEFNVKNPWVRLCELTQPASAQSCLDVLDAMDTPRGEGPCPPVVSILQGVGDLH